MGVAASGLRPVRHGPAVASVDAFCTIPYDAAHPDPSLALPILDWGKVTRIEHLVGTFGGDEVEVEVLEIAGQRATYRTQNDFPMLGTLDHVKVGDLLALCAEGKDDLYHLASGPLTLVKMVIPLSAPPRLAEIAPFEPRHIRRSRVREPAEQGLLSAGRYLVYAEIGRADGAQFAIDRDDWRITVAPGAHGGDRIATGKRLWLVIGDAVVAASSEGRSRPVLRVYAAFDELFP